jgi:Predicted membrane protein (DUF2142)
MTKRGLFLAIFGCLLALVTAENFGTPRNAGPDEPAHIVRGAGLVRGELLGTQLAEWSAQHGGDVPDAGGADIASADPDSDALRVFDVPRWVRQPSEACFAHNPVIPASCATVVDTEGTGALSTAAHYPIWAHLLPGVATVVIDGPDALWLARFLHALIPVALIAATLARLVAGERRAAASATLLAMTPMVLFLLAVVNPSGFVVAGAIALWVAADDAYRTSDASSWLLPAGFAALVLPRDDGLLWAALTLAVLAVVWRRSPMVLWRGAPTVNRVAVVLVALVGAAWAALSGSDLVPVARPATGVELVEIIVERTGRHVREAVGVLGWLDTAIPESAYALWFFGAGIVAMIALVTDYRRRVAGAALALALFVVAGWVLESIQAETAGLFWQGRYALPMLIGFVLVAALTPGADRRIGQWAAAAPGVIAIIVWNLSFLQQLRRWGVSESGSIRPWAWDTYGAPLPLLLLIAVHLAASIGLCVLALRAPTRP